VSLCPVHLDAQRSTPLCYLVGEWALRVFPTLFGLAQVCDGLTIVEGLVVKAFGLFFGTAGARKKSVRPRGSLAWYVRPLKFTLDSRCRPKPPPVLVHREKRKRTVGAGPPTVARAGRFLGAAPFRPLIGWGRRPSPAG